MRRRGRAARRQQAHPSSPIAQGGGGEAGFGKRKIKRRLTRSRVAASRIDRPPPLPPGNPGPARTIPSRSLATAVAARSQWGSGSNREMGRAEEEEEDYTARATACNMQKGPPRLELARLFASTSGMQVGCRDWAFYGSLGGTEGVWSTARHLWHPRTQTLDSF